MCNGCATACDRMRSSTDGRSASGSQAYSTQSVLDGLQDSTFVSALLLAVCFTIFPHYLLVPPELHHDDEPPPAEEKRFFEALGEHSLDVYAFPSLAVHEEAASDEMPEAARTDGVPDSRKKAVRRRASLAARNAWKRGDAAPATTICSGGDRRLAA